MLVLCEDVVHECSSTSPVTKNEERVVLQFFVGKLFPVFFFLQCGEGTEQSANKFCEVVFYFFARIDVLVFGYRLKCLPVCSDEGVDRKFAEF
jgi:hypothetical protein